MPPGRESNKIPSMQITIRKSEARSGREFQGGLMFSVNDWNANKVELNTKEVQAKESLFARRKTKYFWTTHMQIWNKINPSVTL